MMIFLEIALAPVIALLIYFYRKDKYEREPMCLLAKAFFCGVAVTIPILIVELFLSGIAKNISGFFLKIFFESFVIAGVSEEAGKFFVFIALIYNNKEFNEPYDAIIYAVMISLGFAAFENLAYVFGSYLRAGFIGGFATGFVRALLSVPAHALFGAIMGYFFGLSKFSKNKKSEIGYIYAGLIFAIIMHGFFDFFIFTKAIIGLICMLLTFAACGFVALRAIKIHLANSPFNHKDTKL